MANSETVTQGVRIRVQSRYVPEHSDPDQGGWLFAYTVSIANDGEQTVQLLTRHWIITDANGKIEEVEGPGVVGAQPILEPGQSFEYTSACPLRTAFGTMHGSYGMVVHGGNQGGDKFDAEIAAFSLSTPYAVN